MLLTNWLKNLFRIQTRSRRNRHRFQSQNYLPGRAQAVESLEDRTLLTFVSILSGTEVAFQGSSGNDSLTLREQSGTGLLEFSTNGSVYSTDLGGGKSRCLIDHQPLHQWWQQPGHR